MNILIDNDLSVAVTRTKRTKTVSIKIVNGSVCASVPDKMSDYRIGELIKKRKVWIKRKLIEESKIIISKPKEYVSGESFTYLGKNYRLKILLNNQSTVKLVGGYIEVGAPKKLKKNTIRELLLDWYQTHAIERLTEKTNRYAKIIGVCPKIISVRDYKSQWGSCSRDSKISYNWRLIIAPHRVVDYVVVHELCHLLEFNHTKDYWRHVSSNFRDYKECRDWLRVNGVSLII